MNSKYRYIIQSSVLRTEKPVELNKFNKKILAANMDETERAISALPVDVEDWLPAASKQYHISPKLEDYIIVPVIAFFSDLPNRNSVGFPLQELIKFNPESLSPFIRIVLLTRNPPSKIWDNSNRVPAE